MTSPMRIYVEGGGDNWPTLTACRQGFREFLSKVLPSQCRPRIIAAGGRDNAYQSFCTALKQSDALVVLLVDSEDPVAGRTSPWAHLKTRDRWDQPNGATDDQVQLMVTCTEAWLLADKEALAEYYGQGFRLNSLPKNAAVETLLRRDIRAALEHATANTRTKGRYHKTKHAFALLGLIDPAKVRKAAPHADRLCRFLLTKC